MCLCSFVAFLRVNEQLVWGRKITVFSLNVKRKSPRELFGLGLFAVWNVSSVSERERAQLCIYPSFCSVAFPAFGRGLGAAACFGEGCRETGTQIICIWCFLIKKKSMPGCVSVRRKGLEKTRCETVPAGQTDRSGESYSSCRELCCN